MERGKKMSKNRKDGKYIPAEDPVHGIMPYLIEKRVEAEVSQTVNLDVTKLVKWVEEKNKNLDFKFTYFHAFASIFGKLIFNRPLLNRFIQGHRTYERDKVTISFVAKDKFSDEAKEKIIVLEVKKDENALELGHRMAVDIFKTRKEGTNSMDSSLKTLTKLPRCILKIVAKIIKWLDYHGKLPESFTNGDYNYATILFSNLGSIKSDSCYHHLNNYGTNSIIITIGTIKETNKKYTVDITATLDERIADGFYFAKTLKLAQQILDNPEILEENLSTKIELEEKK